MEVELDLWSSRSNDQVDHILDDVDCCDIPGEVDEFILAGCSSNHSSHSQHMVDLDGKADLSSTGPVDSMASNHHHHHHQFHHHHQLGFYDEPNSSFQLIPQRDQHHQHLQQHQQQQQEPQQQIQYQRGNPNNQSSSSSSTSSSSVSPTEEVDYCDVDLSQLTNSNHIGLGQQHHLGGHYVGQHQQHPQQQFASPTPVSFISQQQAAGNQLHYNTSATSGVSNESLVASRVDHCYILNETSQQVVASLGGPHDHQLQQVANISSSTGCNALPDREQMQMLLESKPQPIPSLMTNTNPNVSKQQNPSPSQTGGRKRRQTNGGQAKRARQQVKCNSKETPVTVSTNLSDTKNTQKQSNDKASKVASSSSSAKAASTTKKTGETRQQPASSSGEKQTSPSNDTKNIRRNQSKSPTSNRAASSTSSFTTSSAGNSGQVSPTLSSCSSSGVSSLSSLSFSSGSPTNSCDEPNSNDEPTSIASSEQQLVAASTCGRGVKKPRQTKVVVGSSSCPSTSSSSSTSSGKAEQQETKAKLAKGLQESPQEAQSAAKHKGENNSTSAPRTIKVEPTGQPTFSLSRMLNQAQQQKRQTNGVSSTTTNTNTANRTAPTKTNSIASQLSFEANLSPSSRQKLSNLSSCLIINSQPADQPSTSCLSSSSSSSSSTSASPAPTSSQPASDKHLVGTIVKQPVARGRSSVSSTSSSSSSTSSESQPKALGSPTISQQFSPSIVTFVSSASLSSSSSSSMSSLSSSSNSTCSTALTSASHSPASSVSSSPTMQLGLSVSSPGLVGSSCTQRSTTMTTTTSGTTTTTTSTKTSTSTSLASSAALAATMATNLISNQDWKSAQSGQVVVLTEEERRTLVAEGYPIPQRFPLSKAEERSLKKIRRKIKNKISAQESRRKKKEYMEELEKKVQEMELRIAELERQNELLSGGGGGGGGRHDATAIKHKCDQQVDLELNRVIVEQDAELAAAQTATSTAATTSATSQANQQVQTTMNTSSYHSQQQAQQQIQRKNSTQSNLSSSNDDDNFIDDILMSQERQDVDIAQQVGEVDLVANLVGVDGEPEAAQQQQQQQVSDIKTGALINVLASFSGQPQETQQQQLVVGLTPSTS